MKLTVLFRAFERGRKNRPKQIRASVDVEIREVTADQAPVAIRVGAHQGHEVFEYRWFDDRLWSPVHLDNGRPVARTSPDCTIERIERQLELRGDSVRVSSIGHQLIIPVDTPESMSVKLADWAEGTLLVDGRVHREVSEPRYVVKECGVPGSGGFAEVQLVDHFDRAIPSDRYFPVNDLEGAIRLSEKLSGRQPRTEGPPIDTPVFSVYLPEALTVSPWGGETKVLATGPKRSETTGLVAGSIEELKALKARFDEQSGGLKAADGRPVYVPPVIALRLLAELLERTPSKEGA